MKKLFPNPTKHTHDYILTKLTIESPHTMYNKNLHHRFHHCPPRGKIPHFSRSTKEISGEWSSFATKNCSQFVKIFQHPPPPSLRLHAGHRSASKNEVNRQNMGKSINCPCYRRISMPVKKYRRNKPIYTRNTGIYNIKFTPPLLSSPPPRRG